jgi:ABC-type nitrate/sulfonate/bicarbonate transport system substrate-binding protein
VKGEKDMIYCKSDSRFAALSLAALAVIVLSGTGCRPQREQAGPPEKITIAHAESTGVALVHIAIAKGYFTEEGLDATPQSHATGKSALDAVIAGKADLATVSDTPIMFAVMDNKKIATIAVIATSNRNVAILARKDRAISKPADLNGKTIGVVRGTIGDFFADTFLITHGIDRNKVTIIDLRPDEMAAALGTGRVDAVSIWHPFLLRLQNELRNKEQSFYDETLYTSAICVTVLQDFVKQHPEAVRKFLRALIKAETLIKQHPEESRRLAAEFVKTDEALLDKIWDLYQFRVTLDQAFLVDLEDQTRWAMKNRLTKRRDMPNYLDFIDVDGLQAVKPEAVRIIR